MAAVSSPQSPPPSPVETAASPSLQQMDPASEARWSAWIVRGRTHDRLIQGRLRLALIAVIVGGVGTVLFRLGGAR